MKQKFEIPYNFDFALVDKLLPYKEFIDFVYMPSFYEDGGNSRKDLVIKESVPYEWEEYLNHLSTIQNNFDVGILIQENCTLELIDKYYSLGVKIFVMNDDNLALMAKDKYADIRCILSITRILSLEDIQNNDYSMYDEIVLFFNFCRQVQLLKELPTKYKYVLIINSHCVYDCNRASKHWKLNADTIEDYISKVNPLIYNYCGNIYREDRAFILPQDLIYFNDYIANYKLVDRLMPTEDIIYEIDRYTKEYESTKKDISWYMIGGE